MYIDNNGGNLYAVDVNSGKIHWRYHTAEALMSNPLVWRDVVIVGEGNGFASYPPPKRRLVFGSAHDALLAVDIRTGKLRWLIHLPGSGMPTPAIIGGMLVQHNGGRGVLIVDPESGAIRNRADMQSATTMSAIVPMADGDFASNGVEAYAVQKRKAVDGSLVWVSLLPNAWGLSDCPAASDGRSVFCDYNGAPPGSKETWQPSRPAVEHAFAVDNATGRLRWDVALESGIIPPRNQAAVPLVAGNTLFFGSSIGPYVHALNADDGSIRWRLRAHGLVRGGIAEKQGAVYFGDARGYLWAVDAKSGKVVGSKNLHTSFNVGSPVIDGNTLVIGSNTGSIIAIPLDTIRDSRDR